MKVLDVNTVKSRECLLSTPSSTHGPVKKTPTNILPPLEKLIAKPAASPLQTLNSLLLSQNPFLISRCVAALDLDDKNNEELIDIYIDLREEAEEEHPTHPDLKPKFYAIAAEVKDRIIHKAAESRVFALELAQCAETNSESLLAREIRKTQATNTPFKRLDTLFNKTITPTAPESTRPISALHASFEYTKAKVGGVGAVAESLLATQKEKGLNARIVTPYYRFYQADPSFAEATFVGFVEHEYAPSASGLEQNNDTHMAKSAIYKIKTQNGVVQYLVKPDPRYCTLFDIQTPGDIYEFFPHSTPWDRAFYLTSAIAAMAATYTGSSNDKKFDVLHIHTWTIGLAGRLIKEKYNSDRERAGLAPVSVVQHFHGGSIGEDGNMSGNMYKRMGLEPANVAHPKTARDSCYSDMSLQRDAWLFGTDSLIHVSPFYEKLATDSKTKIFKVSRYLKQKGALQAILNGINHKNYDICSRRAYGRFAIRHDGSRTRGASRTPFVNGKRCAKAALFQEGVIADANKPLYMFVGRYMPEKGVNMLPSMAQEAINNGGQVVIMGIQMGDSCSEELRVLREMQRLYPNCMRVYTDINDQTGALGNSGISKGSLIRQASDFFLIPSHKESCGLVGLEALAAGALVISSNVEGLSSFLVNHPDAAFNAFTYDNGPSVDESMNNDIHSIDEHLGGGLLKNKTSQNSQRITNAKAAVSAAAQYHRNTDRVDRERTIKRIWESSKQYDWNAKDGAVDKITAVYSRLRSSGGLEPPCETELQNIIAAPSRWRRLINAIKKVFLETILQNMKQRLKSLPRHTSKKRFM